MKLKKKLLCSSLNAIIKELKLGELASKQCIEVLGGEWFGTKLDHSIEYEWSSLNQKSQSAIKGDVCTITLLAIYCLYVKFNKESSISYTTLEQNKNIAPRQAPKRLG